MCPAGILWLGNVAFDAGPEEAVKVRPDQALHNAAALLECDPGDLAKVLSSKVINAGGETILTALKMDAALDTRCSPAALLCMPQLLSQIDGLASSVTGMAWTPTSFIAGVNLKADIPQPRRHCTICCNPCIAFAMVLC